MQKIQALTHAGVRTWAIAGRLPALAVVLCGIVVVYLVGLSSLPQAHNATHDTRHASGFPCH
ncbi:MAG TPA: CbtB domain-containing protein [Bryobacteraceae bacterium]|nr:CbtB domain-containing protein [Bryobacteraceae bacterium]